MWTARLAGPRATDQQQSAACDAFRQLDDDLLEPLFEAPIDDLWAVRGPVADELVERLSAWEAPAPDYPSLVVGIDRLRFLVENGWTDAEGLRKMATRAVGQLGALPDDSQSFGFIEQLAALLRTAPPGDEIDQLATSMAARPGTFNPPARFASVLRLPVQENTKPAITNAVTAWLQGASLDAARRFVIDDAEALTDFDFDPAPTLTKRWLAVEGHEWAELAVEFDDDSDAELLPKALAAAPDGHYPVLAEEAAGIAADRDNRQSGDAILDQLAVRCPQVAADRLADLGDALEHLQRIGVDCSPLAAAIATRIGSEPALAQLTHSVRQLHERGIKDMRTLATPLAARGSAAGGILLADVPWVVRCTNGSNEARRVAIRVIESDPVQSVCELSNSICPGLRRHAEVNLALIRRAASVSAEDEATMLLDAASGWKKPVGDEYREYKEQLTAVANRWSSDTVTNLVNRLQ